VSRARRRGSIAIEFALTLPLLLALVSALLDYSWYLARSADLLLAVREGTRFAVTTPLASGPDAVAVTQTLVALDGSGFDCAAAACAVATTLTTLPTTTAPTLLTVTGTARFEPLVGIVPVPLELRGQVAMLVER
jgi:Flp pilus assembly protein TadG